MTPETRKKIRRALDRADALLEAATTALDVGNVVVADRYIDKAFSATTRANALRQQARS